MIKSDNTRNQENKHSINLSFCFVHCKNEVQLLLFLNIDVGNWQENVFVSQSVLV